MSMKFAGRDFKKNPLTREDTQVRFDDPEDKSLTQQHHNDGGKLDTTKIMARFFENGIITHTRDVSARYMDATLITDFREAMTTKARADQSWEALDHKIKKEFDYDQKAFVEYCLNEANIDTLREWGLAAPIKTTEPLKPVEVIITNPTPQGDGAPA